MTRQETDPTETAPLPEGARDVLPVEAAELAAIEASLRATFAGFGYRQVRTPLLEFADVMDRAQDGGLGRAYRMFDDHGQVLVVRPDLTIPVARLVAGRLGEHPGPLRVSYIAERVRPAPAGRAERAEELQAGIELVGLSGPAADAEVVAAVVVALQAVGIDDLRVALGDVSLTQAVLEGLGVAEADQTKLREAVRARNLVAWRRAAEALPVEPANRALVATLPGLRGGRDVLTELATRVPSIEPACEALLATLELLDAHGAGDVVMVDLGVLRDWGYYSGVVVEAYAPGVGRPVAVGGRYDGLVGKFGRARPAIGAAVILDRLHEAIAARNGDTARGDGIVLVGGIDTEVAVARALRAAGFVVIGIADGDDVVRLAEVDGWRFAVQRSGDGYAVTDCSTGDVVVCTDVVEELRSRRL